MNNKNNSHCSNLGHHLLQNENTYTKLPLQIKLCEADVLFNDQN